MCKLVVSRAAHTPPQAEFLLYASGAALGSRSSWGGRAEASCSASASRTWLPSTASWMLWNSSSLRAGFSKNWFWVRSFTTCAIKEEKKISLRSGYPLWTLKKKVTLSCTLNIKYYKKSHSSPCSCGDTLSRRNVLLFSCAFFHNFSIQI